MSVLKKCLFAWGCLLAATPVFAVNPTSKPGSRSGTAAALSATERYARRCQPRAPNREIWPNGTPLWGTKQHWNKSQAADERSSVLVSADLDHLALTGAGVTALRFEAGRLVASSDAAGAGPVAGTVLRGAGSDGQPAEVSVCDAEPATDDPDLVWYRIEAWNPISQDWENPCVATGRVPHPRALVVSGVWDASGAHQDVPGKITFACESGTIAKCAGWGYKPWASRDGHPLAELHQACTRLARADYCGNGRSHTRNGVMIDVYDALGVQTPTTQAETSFDPARVSLEGAWGPDGATCLAHTRDGSPLAAVLAECPGKFQMGADVDLGQGDHCTAQRVGVNPGAALLRNRSPGTESRTLGAITTE